MVCERERERSSVIVRTRKGPSRSEIRVEAMSGEDGANPYTRAVVGNKTL